MDSKHWIFGVVWPPKAPHLVVAWSHFPFACSPIEIVKRSRYVSNLLHFPVTCRTLRYRLRRGRSKCLGWIAPKPNPLTSPLLFRPKIYVTMSFGPIWDDNDSRDVASNYLIFHSLKLSNCILNNLKITTIMTQFMWYKIKQFKS